MQKSVDNGYILLSRSILDSEVFASKNMLKIWIWCLLKANHKNRFIPLKIGRGEITIEVKRGQFVFGRFKAEDELFIDGSTIYKIMKKLEQIGNIQIESNNQYSIVTICNYNTYQDPDKYKVTSKEQLSNNQRTTKEQPKNTNKNVKNVKNVKKEDLKPPKNKNVTKGKKGDFIDKIVDTFSDEFLSSRKFKYVKSVKDRSAVGKLLKNYKISNPEADSEKTEKDMRNFFKVCLAIDPVKQKWLYENMNLSIINSKLNEIRTILRNRNARNNEIREAINRNFE